MIRHKSALNVVRIWGRYVGLNEQDRFAQVASMSWDVHVIEVYGTMAARATSVTCPDLVKKSGPDMQVWLKEKQISGMSVVPSHPPHHGGRRRGPTVIVAGTILLELQRRN